MKLQKLVYYCQAWHLVWEGKELFPEPIEAWAKGPVVPDLYAEHRGYFSVARWPRGDTANLSAEERDTVGRVLGFYGPKSGKWLSAVTHEERPWKEARGTLRPGARSTAEIQPEVMRDYYASLG